MPTYHSYYLVTITKVTTMRMKQPDCEHLLLVNPINQGKYKDKSTVAKGASDSNQTTNDNSRLSPQTQIDSASNLPLYSISNHYASIRSFMPTRERLHQHHSSPTLPSISIGVIKQHSLSHSSPHTCLVGTDLECVQKNP